jgi:ubiquinone/menaquinone biosynthesis C-methylase UbiE
MKSLELEEEIIIQDYNAEAYENNWLLLRCLANFIDKLILRKFIFRDLLVLDCSCGIGIHSQIFKENSCDIIGLDISLKMAERAKLRIDKVVVSDASIICFKSNIFDSVLVFNVLHHLINPHELIQEIYRVLKVNGSAFFIDPISPKFLLPLRKFFYKINPRYSSLHKVFTAKQYKNLIESEFIIKETIFTGSLGISLVYLLDDINISKFIPFRKIFFLIILGFDMLINFLTLYLLPTFTILFCIKKYK